MPSRPAHSAGRGSRRDYRRVTETLRNNATGTGSGSSGTVVDTASYWVLEEDVGGNSKWLLEEGTFFWITEESA